MGQKFSTCFVLSHKELERQTIVGEFGMDTIRVGFEDGGLKESEDYNTGYILSLHPIHKVPVVPILNYPKQQLIDIKEFRGKNHEEFARFVIDSGF